MDRTLLFVYDALKQGYKPVSPLTRFGLGVGKHVPAVLYGYTLYGSDGLVLARPVQQQDRGVRRLIQGEVVELLTPRHALAYLDTYQGVPQMTTRELVKVVVEGGSYEDAYVYLATEATIEMIGAAEIGSFSPLA